MVASKTATVPLATVIVVTDDGDDDVAGTQ